ncbi:MAG: FABP family protein [Acidimicrobiia bacterium]|nr:FABP family protein [Acidimicrobiia bacterium]
MADLHPDLASLAFLVGTWSGEGRGDYPTIDEFGYVEEITIGHVGKPVLAYVQKSRHADTGLPLHGESGYYRPAGPTGIELAIAHPFGAVEVSEGTVDGQRIELMSHTVATTTTAKKVSEVRRIIEVEGDAMHYVLDMAAVGQPLQFHLEATLHRQP